jgi:hypothetical protein
MAVPAQPLLIPALWPDLLIRINAPVRGFGQFPPMPQKSMLIKVLLALIVKLAIVGAAVYWFWPTPKAPQMPQRVDSGITLPHSG